MRHSETMKHKQVSRQGGPHTHLANTGHVHTLICPCIKVDDLKKGRRAGLDVALSRYPAFQRLNSASSSPTSYSGQTTKNLFNAH